MKRILMTATAAMALASPALAETIEVEMLNRDDEGNNMVFGQELIEAEVGDVIRFVPTDKGHNAQSVDGAIPEGQEGFKGRINQEIEYEITEAGLTAVICQPHVGLGMAALIVAGEDTSNADAVLEARIPGRSGDKIEALVEEARAMTEGGEMEDTDSENS
ncbi:Pseudoazurin precursor [Roseivivax sp. THAF40]|uniref:plastocyanin/azurin family copper-binding protein n=1 Tax=unclassified Roseivivax TaxID=2639302 RepID=UPI00126831E0|nr:MULTISPECIES: plastocyanin/azurin family copper-binding protein [unclassified Roseivivax]QFS82747.1 Pseudoazurin precursor [Roseivivax sp. THAF197b]QFT46516.1 Pseudoazurin precursor [Roseivivax sp. THAF40]